MLHQITYEENSPISAYFRQNGLIDEQETYKATNSLFEELEQGNIENFRHTDNIEDYYTQEQMYGLLSLFYGRRLVSDYVNGTYSRKQYLTAKIRIVLMMGIVMMIMVVMRMGVSIAIGIVMAVIYLFFRKLSVENIQKSIQNLDSPEVELLQAFRLIYTEIKENEFIQRARNHLSGIIEEDVKTIEDYSMLCFDLRRHTQERLNELIKQYCMTIERVGKHKDILGKITLVSVETPKLTDLKQTLQNVHFLRKQLKSVLTTVLLDLKLSDIKAYDALCQSEDMSKMEIITAKSIIAAYVGRKATNNKRIRNIGQTNDLVQIADRLDFCRRMLYRQAIGQDKMYDRVVDVVTMQTKHILERLQRLAHKKKVIKKEQIIQDQSRQLQAGNQVDEEKVEVADDFELQLTEDGKKIRVKKREFDKVAEELERLLVNKAQKRPIYKNKGTDERIKFNFLAELKRETEQRVLE